MIEDGYYMNLICNAYYSLINYSNVVVDVSGNFIHG